MVDFIGIGAQRCGTTWIYEILNEHPEINMSSEKEIHFFSSNYHFGYNWYNSHFHSINAQKCGEYSTSYLYDLHCPERAYKYNKDIKIILSIRSPIDRFISHHKHEVIGLRYTNKNNNVKSLFKQNPTYLEYGLYFKYLSHWLEHFPRNQILTILFDDIVNNPSCVTSKIYQFIGV